MQNSIKSFTLVELLIVIAILAILAVGLVISINPGEMMAEARDTNRLRDLNSINRALSLIQVDTPTAFLGDPTRIYLSLPNTSPICNTTVQGLTYTCVSEANLRLSNGSGWLPVNVGHIIPTLPLDPRNSLDTGSYYAYIFEQGRWKLTALLESDRSTIQMARDGGPDTGLLEVGPNLNLANFHRGLVGHWTFDEGSGITANDSSGLGNHGTLMNGPTYVTGVVGNALSFDGVDDWIGCVNQPPIQINPNIFTIVGIINPSNHDSRFISPRSAGIDHGIAFIGGAANCLSVMITEIAEINNRSRCSHIGSIPINTWSHWAVIINNRNIRIYINGVLNREFHETINIANWSDMWCIGQRSNNTFWFNGLMDDIRVYSRALSSAEISAIFRSTR